MSDIRQHWENVFATKAANEVSWFQNYPETSVHFIESFHLPLHANIIDVGGGDSCLADVLLEKGYQNIYVLDISANALERAKARLGDKARKINWIVSDVLDFVPPVQFDCWHDRAAFHFLTTTEKINRYISISENAVRKNGHLVIGTFSQSGPLKCSGLEIMQYSAASMSARFNQNFERIKCVEETHHTPFNTTQAFIFCSFVRK